MLIVRDTRDGRAVSWGTDHWRMNEIAATSEHYECWPEHAADDFYWHVQRQGMAWVHPYDLSAQQEAEIKP